MACSGQSGTWTLVTSLDPPFAGYSSIDGTFEGYADDAPFMQLIGSNWYPISSCDGRNLFPAGWIGVGHTPTITSATFTPTQTRYNCLNGNCVEAANGIYSSLADCQNNCGQSGCGPGKVCIDQACLDALNTRLLSIQDKLS